MGVGVDQMGEDTLGMLRYRITLWFFSARSAQHPSTEGCQDDLKLQNVHSFFVTGMDTKDGVDCVRGV